MLTRRETHNKNKFDAGHIVKLSIVYMPRQIRTISWQTSLDTGFTPTLVQCLLFMLPLTSAIRKMHFPVTAGEARKKENMLSYHEAQKSINGRSRRHARLWSDPNHGISLRSSTSPLMRIDTWWWWRRSRKTGKNSLRQTRGGGAGLGVVIWN